MSKKFIEATNKADDKKILFAINHIVFITDDMDGCIVHLIDGGDVMIKEEYDLFENALLTMCGDYD